VRRFLAAHPGATVVALGEGLETQFWRVDDGRVSWLGVDVPEVVALRERLLPRLPRARSVAGSVLDDAWLDEVDPSRPVLVTAQGLLMYLERAEVHRLVAGCARRLPGGRLLFDTVPAWLAARTREETVETRGGYRPPPWLWSVDAAEERALAAIPGVAGLRALRLPRGRGLVHGWALPLVTRVPAVRRLTLSVYVARLAG
jgi:O-methyltransferase involved in polyketide biosynthesis